MNATAAETTRDADPVAAPAAHAEFALPQHARVTIIVPAHNAEATLAQTLDSILWQTCPDWRAIIVDDASTDATIAVAARYMNDRRFRLVHQPHGGVAAARNFGAGLAETPWLVFLDADDLISPAYLAEMLAAADAHSPDLVYCSGHRLAPDGRTGYSERPPASDHLRHLRNRNIFYTHALMISRACFEAHGGFRETLRSCEDWDLWLRLFRSGVRVAELDKAYAAYRMRPGSLTREPRTLFDCGRNVIDRAYAEAAADLAEADGTGRAELEIARRQALLHLGIWAFATSVGGGAADPSLLAGLATSADVSVEDFAIYFVYGAANGACLLPSDWPDLWTRLQPRITTLFVEIASGGAAGFDAASCLARLGELALSGKPI